MARMTLFYARFNKALEAGFKASKQSGGEALRSTIRRPPTPRRLPCQPSQHRARHRKQPLSCGRRLLPNQYATRQARHRHFGIALSGSPALAAVFLWSRFAESCSVTHHVVPEQVSLEMTRPFVVELWPWGGLWLKMPGMLRFGGTGSLILRAGRSVPTFALRRTRYGRMPVVRPGPF